MYMKCTVDSGFLSVAEGERGCLVGFLVSQIQRSARDATTCGRWATLVFITDVCMLETLALPFHVMAWGGFEQ